MIVDTTQNRDTPEASGTARKAPSGPSLGGPSPSAETGRLAGEAQSGEAEHSSRLVPNPRAKPVPKHEGTADALIAQVGNETAGSRLGVGRTAHAAGDERGDPAASISAVGKPERHRWGEKVTFPHKSERECLNGCGITKVSRHESEGGRDRYWVEFWRDLDQIPGVGTPPCEPVAEGMRG